MSVERLNELKRQADELTAGERLQLADYLLEKVERGKSAPESRPDDSEETLKRERHMKWLREHQAEYPDQYVALDGDRLLAHGNTFREVAEAIRGLGIPSPFITRIPDPDKVYYVGL